MKYIATIYCRNYPYEKSSDVYFWTVLVNDKKKTLTIENAWCKSYPCKLPELGRELDYEMDEFWRIGDITYQVLDKEA